MTINLKFLVCVVCGEKIFEHSESIHAIACLKTLHEWLTGYANTNKMLQALGSDYEPFSKNVTKSEDRNIES